MSFTTVSSRALTVVLASAVLSGTVMCAQSEKDKPKPAQSQQEQDPLKRPLTEKQKKQQEKEFQKETGKFYRKWLDEDVRWIISDEEKSAFKQLSNDEERDAFIENFWLRRD